MGLKIIGGNIVSCIEWVRDETSVATGYTEHLAEFGQAILKNAENDIRVPGLYKALSEYLSFVKILDTPTHILNLIKYWDFQAPPDKSDIVYKLNLVARKCFALAKLFCNAVWLQDKGLLSLSGISSSLGQVKFLGLGDIAKRTSIGQVINGLFLVGLVLKVVEEAGKIFEINKSATQKAENKIKVTDKDKEQAQLQKRKAMVWGFNYALSAGMCAGDY